MVGHGFQAFGGGEVRRSVFMGFDGLAGPAGLLTDHFVEGDGTVGEGDGADYEGGAVVHCCAVFFFGGGAGGLVGGVLVVLLADMVGGGEEALLCSEGVGAWWWL